MPCQSRLSAGTEQCHGNFGYLKTEHCQIETEQYQVKLSNTMIITAGLGKLSIGKMYMEEGRGEVGRSCINQNPPLPHPIPDTEQCHEVVAEVQYIGYP